VFPLALSPLRDRVEDIAPLAFSLMLRHVPQGQSTPWLSDAALDLLRQHAWPGNVRELENVMRRALLLGEGCAAILPEHIHFDGAARLVASEPPVTSDDFAVSIPGGGGRRLSNIVQQHEARAILETLAACGGRRVDAARQLGISERTLRYRLASFREAGIGLASTGVTATVIAAGAGR